MHILQFTFRSHCICYFICPVFYSAIVAFEVWYWSWILFFRWFFLEKACKQLTYHNEPVEFNVWQRGRHRGSEHTWQIYHVVCMCVSVCLCDKIWADYTSKFSISRSCLTRHPSPPGDRCVTFRIFLLCRLSLLFPVSLPQRICDPLIHLYSIYLMCEDEWIL